MSFKKKPNSISLDKIVYLINIWIVLLLLLSYISPYFFIDQMPYLQVLSLIAPLLITSNALFLIYWFVRRDKKIKLFLLIFFIGFFYVPRFYQFPKNYDHSQGSSAKLMSYNVRLFNIYNWINKDGIAEDIVRFINKKSPDILCIQEFYADMTASFEHFPHKYIYYKAEHDKVGLAIFSKFPIINKQSLEFPNTYNNTIYADLLVGKDTLRVYNVHLESLKINPNDSESTDNPKRAIANLSHIFSVQKIQTNIIKKSYQNSPYKNILCGDFNNTSLSFVYNHLRGNLKDSFEQAGSGFGSTYRFKFIPFRIDYVLVDSDIEILEHHNYYPNLSDHNPVEAKISLEGF